MSGWTAGELAGIGTATELELASRGPEGGFTTMWVVLVGDDVYVRSAGGADRPWYRHAIASGSGRVRAGGVEVDVVFEPSAGAPHPQIDAAYHAKYGRYGPGPVGHVTGQGAHEVTIRLVPSQL